MMNSKLVDIEQSYLDMYKDDFSNSPLNQCTRRNNDPEYWNILLNPIKENPNFWKGKVAFDYGCGAGRNLKNLLELADWKSVEGCDISESNINYAYDFLSLSYPNKVKTWECNGKDIQPAKPNFYHFMMSSVVFQHISNYSVRYNILSDMFLSLKPGGLVSIHFMDLSSSSRYYENSNDYKNSRVENKQYLIDDFTSIGFKEISVTEGVDYFTRCKSYYVNATK